MQELKAKSGESKDLSCIFDDEDFGGTTTTGATTTTGPRDPEDPNFCEGKNDGFYVHPVCSKYYHCASGVTNIRVNQIKKELILSVFRNAAQELSGTLTPKSATGSTTSTLPTAETPIQLRRQRQVHQQQRQQRHQHQRLLPARTTTNSAKAKEMGITDTANARSTTNATSLARL